MSRRRIGLSRYLGNVIDDTRDFLDDVIDRTNDFEHDLRDTDDDEDRRRDRRRGDDRRRSEYARREDLEQLYDKLDGLAAKLDRLGSSSEPARSESRSGA